MAGGSLGNRRELELLELGVVGVVGHCANGRHSLAG